MIEQDARLLEAFAQLELGYDRAQVHQIGNGEWVVILVPAIGREDVYYCWDASDWRAYMRANPRKDPEEAKVKKQRGRSPRAEEESYQTAIDYTTPHEVLLAAL